MHILINKNYLTINNYKVKCAIGKRGIGYKKKEGDLMTPIGQYKIKYILYRKDRIKKITTRLKKIIKKIWDGVMIIDQKNIINLFIYHLNTIMKNFTEMIIFTILF